MIRSQSRPFSVAIAGLGRIASLLEDDPLREKPCTHAGAISANPNCRLVAGCDPNPQRRAQFAQRWNCPAVYADLATMLSEQQPAILHLATPPDDRQSQVALAARYGVAVVVCEKPLAATYRAAAAIARWPRRQTMTILCNHERRYALDYQHVKQVVGDGRLGRLVNIQANLCMGTGQRLIDVLWHDGTHLVDALLFLTDGVARHRQTVGNLQSAAGLVCLHGQLRRRQNPTVPFCLTVDNRLDHLVFELQLRFSRGAIVVGNNQYHIAQSQPSPYAQGFRSLQTLANGFGQSTGYFAGMVADAVACAADPNRRPLSSVGDALAVVRYLQTVGRRH